MFEWDTAKTGNRVVSSFEDCMFEERPKFQSLSQTFTKKSRKFPWIERESCEKVF